MASDKERRGRHDGEPLDPAAREEEKRQQEEARQREEAERAAREEAREQREKEIAAEIRRLNEEQSEKGDNLEETAPKNGVEDEFTKEEAEAQAREEEQELREELIANLISEIELNLNSPNLVKDIKLLIAEIHLHYPILEHKEIQEIILTKLEESAMAAITYLDLEPNDAAAVFDFIHENKPLPAHLDELLPWLNTYEIFRDIVVVQETVEEAEEKHRKEDQDEDGGEEEELTEELKRSQRDARIVTGLKPKKDKDKGKTGDTQQFVELGEDKIQKLKRGSLTRDMDLELLGNVSEILTSRNFSLKKESLKRVVHEYNFNQFNKPTELLVIAVYLLSYFLQVPPFFQEAPNRPKLSEEDIKSMHLQEFLYKTQAFQVQLHDDPLFKLYYPRLMDKAGHSIMNGDLEAISPYLADEQSSNKDKDSSDDSDPLSVLTEDLDIAA